MEDQLNAPATSADTRAVGVDTTGNLLLASLLNAIRGAETTSRSDLVKSTSLGKALVAQYVELLTQKGIVVEMGVGESRGGRRPRILRFAAELGLIAAIDLGATSVDVAITDLSGKVLDHYSESANVREGPEIILERVVQILNRMLLENNYSADRLWGIGMGIPGPVEFDTGTPISPPIMPGWSDFNIRAYFQKHFACPVYVDNDVNVQAVGEATMGRSAGIENSVYVKVGSGIGAGIILHGRLYRGSQGCAGDIGHIQVDYPGLSQIICRCGNTNCLEALAGGAAIGRFAEEAARAGLSPRLADRLAERGYLTAEDVGEMANKGDVWSTEQIRQSGRLIGYSLAGLVNFINPGQIVIGGGVANFGDRFLATIREMVYGRSLPLATRSLRIEQSSLGYRAGVIGAAHVVLNELFSADSLMEVLNAHQFDMPVSISA